MDLTAAVEAIPEPVVAALARRLAPVLHEHLAEGGRCGCAEATKTRPGAPRRTAYTVAEVARSLGVSTKHIYRLCELGEIPTVRLGRRYVITVETLAEILDRSDGHPATTRSGV